MANYCETWRTNYFQVKDSIAFEKWADTLPNTYIIRGTGSRVGLADDGSESGLPSSTWADGDNDDTEIDFIVELSKHLVEDEVALVMGSGHEGQRYVTGFAVAIDSNGGSVSVNLDEIYRLAEAKFGRRIIAAEY